MTCWHCGHLIHPYRVRVLATPSGDVRVHAFCAPEVRDELRDAQVTARPRE